MMPKKIRNAMRSNRAKVVLVIIPNVMPHLVFVFSLETIRK